MAPSPTASDRALARRMRAGDARAREALVARYLPLATGLTWRYAAHGHERDDLHQVAAVALVKAVDRWDPDRGVDLRSYLAPTVLGELRRYFRDCTWTIRPPRRVQDDVRRLARTRDELGMQLGRSATAGEVADRLGCDQDALQEALAAMSSRRPTSLDTPVQHESGGVTSIGELIPFVDPEFERAEARATLDRLNRVLDARSREVLRLRYEEDLTQSEIAGRVGCSQIQVSRILRAALAKLHAYSGLPQAA